MEQGPLTIAGRIDDDDYPAYTMGRATEVLGVTPAFLRGLGDAGLIEPHRSAGGHRRYSRHQLRMAARARELVDQGTALDAACRIIELEDQLAEARRLNAELRERHCCSGQAPGPSAPASATGPARGEAAPRRAPPSG